VEVEVDRDARQASVAVNETRFTRALLNVLDNAWRANRTAGATGIELHVRRNSKFLEIEVLDNGPGIKSDPVHQKSGWGSTGLGLAFARKVTASHGGSLLLSLRKDAPNGTSVLMSLPIP
jgi:signal transduction histidine kinase